MTSTLRPSRLASSLLALIVISPVLAQSQPTNAPPPLELSAVTPPNLPSSPKPQTAPPPDETEAQRKARELHEQSERELKAEEKQRIGGVMPNFNVVISGSAVPLSPAQKFDLSFHTITDPYTFAVAALVAGYSEVIDSHQGYGHGPAGYFKRAGSAYADNAIGNLVGNAALPVILHQDPRYFRKGTGSTVSRVFYSASTAFICYGDNGRWQFNTSNVLGNFVSGGISNLYYPRNERGAVLTIENAATVTAEGMLASQLLEFAPDFLERVHRKRQAKRDAIAAAKARQP